LMEVRILGCYGGELPGYRFCSFGIDGRLLLEAGAVTSVLRLSEQRQISDILITHSHLDHIKDIPFLAANLIRGGFHRPINVLSIRPVIEEIKSHLFNGALWPDFTSLPTVESPILKFRPIEPNKEFLLQGFTIRAVPVNHTVPAVGFIIRKGHSTILYTGDTGPTDRIWEEAREIQELKAVVVESSYPNRLKGAAESSGHLTPMILKGELKKLSRKDIPILLAHMKPQYMNLLRKEVASIRHPSVSFLRQGEFYRF
jgi:cAMP phosphodiesterase